MPRNPDWTKKEVDLIVEDYFDMLQQERKRISYSKTEHRELLMQKLNDRSAGSIEMKHCNISSALNEIGLDSINGYKDRPHKQQLLVDAVNRYVQDHHWTNQ